MGEKEREQYNADILVAFAERTVKRLWILIILLVLLLFGSNAAWIWYEAQWEDVVTTEVSQETEGGSNNYIGNNGDIVYGKADSNNH